jgi:flagellin
VEFSPRQKGFIMSYVINTNVAALQAEANAQMTSTALNQSLTRLSSGLRINSAADDAAGLSIANTLNNQALSLGQAISNANDGIGILQTADGAMSQQTDILNTIKTDATEAAQGGQTTASRQSLQANITNLLKELDNIASTTTYNGQSLLSGSFTNKQFQVGAYANQTITASIGSTTADKIGNTRFETSSVITASGIASLTFSNVDGTNNITLGSVTISTSAGTGLGALAAQINNNSDALGGITASYQVVDTGSSAVSAGTISGLTINGVNIGDVTVKAGDSNGVLVNAINSFTTTTGVEASVDSRGNLVLTSTDGRGIKVSGTNLSSIGGLGTGDASQTYGRLTLTRAGAADIVVSASGTGSTALNTAITTGAAQQSVNLRSITGQISADTASAMGFNANANAINIGNAKGAGVTTLAGAMAVMSIADAALKDLDAIRSNIGAVQNQFTATINNITTTQVNVKSAQSQIMDVNFAQESATFNKLNILSQSGAYALTKANTVQQNVLKLLQ